MNHLQQWLIRGLIWKVPVGSCFLNIQPNSRLMSLITEHVQKPSKLCMRRRRSSNGFVLVKGSVLCSVLTTSSVLEPLRHFLWRRSPDWGLTSMTWKANSSVLRFYYCWQNLGDGEMGHLCVSLLLRPALLNCPTAVQVLCGILVDGFKVLKRCNIT